MFTLLETSPVWLFGVTALLGLVIGSFLNVVIHRLPRMMEQDWARDCSDWLIASSTGDSGPLAGLKQEQDPGADQPPMEEKLTLARPASRCPSCGALVRPWQNIPVLSFLLLRGRCASCGSEIGWRYPLVETLTALLSILVIWQFGPTPEAGAALLLTWALIALAFIDLDTQLLPDSITLPLLWIGLVLSLGTLFTDSHSAIIGAVTGYLLLWLLVQLFLLVTGKEGMGRGDFKLLAALGAWLGWQSLPQILLLSTIPGALVGIVLLLRRRAKPETPIPFGPFLAIAGWLTLVWGAEIRALYWGLWGLA